MRKMWMTAVAAALAAVQARAGFEAGFARADITPPLGILMCGYYVERHAEGVHDPLQVNAFAVSDGTNRAVVLACDLLDIQQICGKIRAAVAAKAGIPADAVYIACTHTHTGPAVGPAMPGDEGMRDGLPLYDDFLTSRLADAAVTALADLAPAEIGIARAQAPRISFIRRYRMKDGSLLTNPGVGNPDILEPVGRPDDTVQLVRFRRAGRRDIAVVNFQTHADTVGGTFISADFPGVLRRTFEAAVDGEAWCVFLNGTEGDTNHICTDPRPGELEGLEMETFDGCPRGFAHTRHMGRALAAAALGVWGKTARVPAGPVRFAVKTVVVPSQMPTAAQLPVARKYVDLHNAGRDGEIPFKGMQLAAAVAESIRMLRLEHGPAELPLPISAVTIGDAVAFAGFPGEPFTEIGTAVKEGSPFRMTVCTALTNGSCGYFPVASAYAEGGYEARVSVFASGVGAALVEGQLGLLRALRP